jgi:hypothetical protein
MNKKIKEAIASTTSSKRRVSHAGAGKKGKQFEREIANALGHIFPEAERMLEYQASKVIGVDIEGTDRIKIQCKNHQNYCSIGTIHEIRTKDPNDIPVLVTKGNRLEAMAVLPFDKLVTLLEIAYGLELPFRTFEVEKTKLSSTEKVIEYSDTPRNFKDLFPEAYEVQAEDLIPLEDPRVFPNTSDVSGLLDDLI